MNLDTLIDCGVEPTIARRFIGPLLAACQRWAIEAPIERAIFIAQGMHESRCFVRMEEDLRYRTPERLDAMFSAVHGTEDAAQLIRQGPKAIANRVYAGRFGNRDELSGDGWRYRGRGIFQLTFADNYTRAGLGCGRPYLLMPELVADPADACMSAGWYWRDRKCGEPASSGDVDGVTRKINPAMAGAEERRLLAAETMRAFNLT